MGGSSGTGGGGKLFVFGGTLTATAAAAAATTATAAPLAGAVPVLLEDLDRGFRLKMLSSTASALALAPLPVLLTLLLRDLASELLRDRDAAWSFCFELLISPNSSWDAELARFLVLCTGLAPLESVDGESKMPEGDVSFPLSPCKE